MGLKDQPDDMPKFLVLLICLRVMGNLYYAFYAFFINYGLDIFSLFFAGVYLIVLRGVLEHKKYGSRTAIYLGVLEAVIGILASEGVGGIISSLIGGSLMVYFGRAEYRLILRKESEEDEYIDEED